MTGAASRDPAFTVVIPTRERAALVREAIASALAQSRPPAEIVVVDDGSTDGTPERVSSEFAASAVRLVRSEHRGASAARNLGVQHATSEYVAFLDSDDLFDPRKLEVFCDAIARAPDAVLYHSAWREIDVRTGATRLLVPTARGDARHELLMFTPIATPTVVCRRRHFLECGGFVEGLFLGEDYDLWCRLSCRGPVELIEEPLTTVRLHEGNSFRDAEQILRNQTGVVERFFRDCATTGLCDRSRYLANVAYSIGVLNFTQGNYGRAWQLFARALGADPRANLRRATSMLVRASWKRLTAGGREVDRRRRAPDRR